MEWLVGFLGLARALIIMAGQPGNEFGTHYVLGIIQDGIAGVIEQA